MLNTETVGIMFSGRRDYAHIHMTIIFDRDRSNVELSSIGLGDYVIDDTNTDNIRGLCASIATKLLTFNLVIADVDPIFQAIIKSCAESSDTVAHVSVSMLGASNA